MRVRVYVIMLFSVYQLCHFMVSVSARLNAMRSNRSRCDSLYIITDYVRDVREYVRVCASLMGATVRSAPASQSHANV